jgi:uncharacterized membrane protein YkvI
MRRLLSVILSVAVVTAVTVAAGHQHNEADHGDAHSCLLCVFAKDTFAKPLALYIPAIFLAMVTAVFIPAAAAPLRSFFSVPYSRGPPLV